MGGRCQLLLLPASPAPGQDGAAGAVGTEGTPRVAVTGMALCDTEPSVGAPSPLFGVFGACQGWLGSMAGGQWIFREGTLKQGKGRGFSAVTSCGTRVWVTLTRAQPPLSPLWLLRVLGSS